MRYFEKMILKHKLDDALELWNSVENKTITFVCLRIIVPVEYGKCCCFDDSSTLQFWIHHFIVRWTENVLYFGKSCKIVSLKQLYLHSFISHFLSSFIRQLQDLRFVLEWQAHCLQSLYQSLWCLAENWERVPQMAEFSNH